MPKHKGFRGKHNRHIPAFLLLFLAQGDAHGGALWTQISDMMPADWEVDSGAIYRVLRELEERGCVNSYWNTDDAGPAKRVYHITQAGLDELTLWYEDIQLRNRNLEYFLSEYEALGHSKTVVERVD